MNNVINATYELIDELEKSELIINLRKYKNKVINNSKLMELINKGRNVNDNELILIRKELYQDEDYSNYMKYYTEMIYLVKDLNKRFKSLVKESCNK